MAGIRNRTLFAAPNYKETRLTRNALSWKLQVRHKVRLRARKRSKVCKQCAPKSPSKYCSTCNGSTERSKRDGFTLEAREQIHQLLALLCLTLYAKRKPEALVLASHLLSLHRSETRKELCESMRAFLHAHIVPQLSPLLMIRGSLDFTAAKQHG